MKTFSHFICLSLTLAAITRAGPDFSQEILPILSDKCFTCHGPDENERKADLRLDTAEGALADLGGYAAVVPGAPGESELIHRIFTDDEDDLMPPPESNLTLTKKEKQLLNDWVAAGAEYEMHWAFVKPVRTEVPNIEGARNPIDAFIGKRLQASGMKFSPEADPHRLIRRITLDLTGLPPTLDEVDDFVKDYRNKGEPAYQAAVDRLLKSPRYGETMALPWLDAARYADTDGYQYDGPRFMWRWRDWVINAYNAKMPFDQFTIEQIAGDLLPNATLDQIIATGFNRNHRYNSESGLVVEEFLLENAVDRVDTTSTLWMGLTVGCARCHDHKYDPVSQKDYYQLIAFFNSVPEAGRALKAHNSEPVVVAPTKEQQVILAEKEKAVTYARAALKPGDTPQDGGPLIDRKLVFHHKLNQLPPKGAKVTGNAKFSGNTLLLDGSSQVSIGAINKSLSMRADSKFTLSFWMKPASIEDQVIVSRQTGGDSRKGVEVAIVEGGKIRFDLASRWIAGLGRSTTQSKVKPGEWIHITISNDGSQSANGQKIYFNGERMKIDVANNTNSNVGGVAANQPLLIGAGPRHRSAKFKGAIKEIRMYSTELWAEEIAVLGEQLGSDNRKLFSRTKMTPAYPAYVKKREDLETYRGKLPTVMVMKDLPHPKPTFIRNRGVYNDHGPKVTRNTPEQFPPMPDSYPRNRLGLAKWLVSEEHPLTARVAVNRYWQKYFGTGLVKTAEDFGVQGEAPTHPELLDWLAVEFRESGWDVAAMQKLILLSKTYRQQSKVTPEILERDPENRLLARGPRLRLNGHAIRDQALFVSGLLKERIGGPSVSPYQPASLWAEMSMGMKYKTSTGDDLYRRSLYTIWKRTVSPPAMAVFDAADREACWVSRKETNTPLQALTLLNETAFVESARHLAIRMLKEGGDDPIGFAFKIVTAREMSLEERNLFDSALTEYKTAFSKDPAGAKKLMAVGASLPNKDFPPAQIATYTALANVMLNLDEVITRE